MAENTNGHTVTVPVAESFRVLASIMRQPEHSNAAWIQAANILFDRGWGRAPQARADEDRKDIRVTIRKIGKGGGED
jgi:hypothetical protein